MKADPTWETQRLVYVGRRWVQSKGKLYHAFAPEGSAYTSEDELWYAGAPKWAAVGNVYAIEVSNSQAKVRSGELVGHLRDEELLAAWRVVDRTAGAAQESVRAAKRLQAQGGEIGTLTLAELRGVMEAQPRHVQAGTLTVVLQYLTRS